MSAALGAPRARRGEIEARRRSPPGRPRGPRPRRAGSTARSSLARLYKWSARAPHAPCVTRPARGAASPSSMRSGARTESARSSRRRRPPRGEHQPQHRGRRHDDLAAHAMVGEPRLALDLERHLVHDVAVRERRARRQAGDLRSPVRAAERSSTAGAPTDTSAARRVRRVAGTRAHATAPPAAYQPASASSATSGSARSARIDVSSVSGIIGHAGADHRGQRRAGTELDERPRTGAMERRHAVGEAHGRTDVPHPVVRRRHLAAPQRAVDVAGPGDLGSPIGDRLRRRAGTRPASDP